MRAAKQTESGVYSHDPGGVILPLLRIGTSRSRRVAAVIAVALLTMNQCAGLAYAEATKTVLYLDAPTVSEDRVSAAGEIAGEYALSAASPNSEVLAGLAITAEQQSKMIEMADLPDKIRKVFDTVLSEETDSGITADAALEAGDTMLAQLEGEEDTGEEELASSNAVRPQLGGQDQSQSEQSDEPPASEYASVPVDKTDDPVEPLQQGESGASLVVEQSELEAPPSSEEDIEYASASPEPQTVEAASGDVTIEEEYGSSGPITDTSPVEATLPEEPTDTTSSEPSDSVAESQDAPEPPIMTTQASEETVRPQPVEEAPSSAPEMQEVAAEPAPSEEGDQTQDNSSTLQPVTDTDDTGLETQNEASVAIVVPVFPPSEEMIEESENPLNSTLQSEEPSGYLADETNTGEREVGTDLPESEEPPEDLASNSEASEAPPYDADDPGISVETENEDLSVVEDPPDTTESLTLTSGVLNRTEPDPNATPERNPGDEENSTLEGENQQPLPVAQIPATSQNTQGGRNFENARPDMETRRPDRSERGANRSWEGPKPLKDPGAWAKNIPVSARQTWADASHQSQAVAIAPIPAVSEASFTQIVPQETSVPAGPSDDTSVIQSGEEIVQQQATESIQDDNIRIADVDMSGFVETQALPEYAEPVQQIPSEIPTVPVEQIATPVPTPETSPTPQLEPQIQQAREVVSDFETEVSQ